MAEKEECSSEPSELNDEEMALKGLLDAFGSAFTLDELAYAYCKAGRDADLAAEFLVELRRSASASAVDPINGEARGIEQPVEGRNAVKQACEGNGKPRPTNPRSHPVSIGSVSSVIGKNYVWLPRSKNGSCEATKPMKLDSSVLPESAVWGEEAKSRCGKNDSVHQDMEEFLYSMLGDGFKLERNVIREVLDSCGYDMPKSMEKLIGLSTEDLDKKNKSVCDSTEEFPEFSSKAEVRTGQGKSKNHLMGTEDVASNTKVKVSSEQNHIIDLQREVLTALFGGTEAKSDDLLTKRRSITVKRSGIFGKPVTEPLHDSIVEHKTNAVYPQQQDNYAKEQEDRYQTIRKAVKEYRLMMKEYYQSAVEAFTKGDPDRARKLLEQGYFFHKKAHDAYEESSEMILETRNVEAQDAVVLDLHDHGAREAIRLLKCHLSSFSGVPFKYLKVIIETDEEDSSKGSRRRLVLKLLERESIKWVAEENGNGGTILIELDSFNRKHLSFAKKKKKKKKKKCAFWNHIVFSKHYFLYFEWFKFSLYCWQCSHTYNAIDAKALYLHCPVFWTANLLKRLRISLLNA